jgi:anti-sigma factor RsiW
VSTLTPAELERARALLMAALDGELGPDERRELDRLIADHPALAGEWSRLTRVKEVTAMVTLRTPSDEVWDGYWKTSYRRTERGIGWLLVAAGAIVLSAWGLWHLFESLLADTDTPVAIRLAIAAVVLGGLVLMFSVLREKLFTRRHDPYDREVIR